MTSVHRKWILWALAGIAAIPLALYGLGTANFVLVPSAEDYSHRTTFDPRVWRERSLDNDPSWPTRLRMVDDLIAAKRLDGLGRDQVISLLGAADKTSKWQDWDSVYWLGPERRSLFRIDSEWLVIRFDEAGRVATYRIVGD
jgi:hypothetical protein